MLRESTLALGVVVLCSLSAAQHRIDPTRLRPVTGSIKDAGRVDVTTGRWTRPAQSVSARSAGGVQTIYNNTCTWTGGSTIAMFESCEWNFDEGRVPSTSAPSAPAGAEDHNQMQSFQVSYCTFVPTSSLPSGYDMELAFYDKNNGDCLGFIPQQPPPISSQATAYFDLSGLGLPGSTGAGFQACWLITVDVSNSGWTMASDGDGAFDNDPPNDKFVWAQAQNSATSPVVGFANSDGFLVAADPSVGGYGSCTYALPCGGCGTGLDTFDASWINVDGVAFGSSGGALPSCPDSVAKYGYGTNCYFFGGWPANPFASYYLVLESVSRPSLYCTATTSSCGTAPTIGGPAGSTSFAGSGPGTFDVTVTPVPGGQQPAILIYTNQGPAAFPAITPYGLLCIKNAGLHRVLPPMVPQGAPCSATYTFDFGNYIATQTVNPALLPPNLPATVDMQGWYRDAANPSSANLSNAMSFVVTL